MKNVQKAYSYIRFSTPEQIQGDSLRRQVDSSKAWCAENKVELVEEMRELGVSAFRGKHRMVGVLSDFLKIVEAGKIQKGSYLLIENLDRLTRENLWEALELYTRIIRSGITIVTLIDKHVHSRESIEQNPMILNFAICSMARGNEESELKSKRISETWKTKRSKIGEEKMTARCPTWLKLSWDRKTFEPVKENVRIVRRIFQMTLEGKGRNSICKTLNSEEVPCLGYGKSWYPSTIGKILQSRAVIGEFTPHVGTGSERKPLDPEPEYYPSIIDSSLFFRVQQIRKSRPRFNGAGQFNAFVGIAKDARTGERISYCNKNRSKGWHYLVPTSCTTGRRPWISWQYDEFLSLFLAVCRKARSGVGNASEEESRLLGVMAEQERVEEQIETLLDNLQQAKSKSASSRLQKLDQRLESLLEEKDDLHERIANQKLVVDLPVNESSPELLRDAIGRNVRILEMDIESKSFTCTMHNGLKYEARLTDGEVEMVTTDSEFLKSIKQSTSPKR